MALDEIYDLHPLFEDVQIQKVFPDGKTFVDCIPKYPLEKISEHYNEQKAKPGFNLQSFVLGHFSLPVPHSDNYKHDPTKNVVEHIESLWPILTRKPDKKAGSIIPLPYAYIVPGGRFGEIYYWDSYFTMLGLKVSGKVDMIENMVNNFSFLLQTIGFIPNGNRTYFLGRSQPPFYSLMVSLLAELKGKHLLIQYLPNLEIEYQFWMKESQNLNEQEPAKHHAVRMPGGEILNRYWDEHDSARPESFAADIELAKQSKLDERSIFRHLRAGAESGWDYSGRWFKNESDFATIHTADIIPVDLNGLLYHLEKTISDAHELNGNLYQAQVFNLLASNRKAAIRRYCWNGEEGFYFDYDWKNQYQKNCWTLAGATPLFFLIAAKSHADQIAVHLNEKFLHDGGLVTSLKKTGQQWDAPNGWAPLHWMVVKGLENYGHPELAATIANRWIEHNTDVYKRTGKLMEKYNVVETHLEAGGGEYQGQDGFGWTNGVLLSLIKKYGA